MKHAYIITMHAMHNPGSVFQAYALQSYLEKIGLSAEIIDYRPSYYFTESNLRKHLVKMLVFFKAYSSRKKKFNVFLEKNMHLTKKFSHYRDLVKAGFSDDTYFVGSDQLWNTDFACGSDDAFYLSFVQHGKKVSYSTSVGKKAIDERNLNVLKSKLKSFDYLSVREKSTSEQLSNVLCRNVKWVCDPVFLLKARDYNSFIGKALINKKYILVYLSCSSELLDKIVDYYRNKGCFIVLAGGFTRRCCCDLHIKDVGPCDFLNLINYADAVVSSSFHATAFSIIFHKMFFSILPEKNGERITSLLDYLGLEFKYSGNSFDSKLLEMGIDWQCVDKQLDKYVLDSKAFINEAIKE